MKALARWLRAVADRLDPQGRLTLDGRALGEALTEYARRTRRPC